MVTRELVEAHDAVLVLKDMPFRANDPDFVCKYKDIIMLEKEELHARIEKSAAHIWLDAGICLSPKRFEMISHLIVEEDMQLDMAQERLLFWIGRIKEYEAPF